LDCDHVRKIEGRIDLRQVHAHHPASGTDEGGGHLEPASRPAAKVRDPGSTGHQLVGALELGQLVGGAGAKALALGALVEAVLALVTRGREEG
jgi:hypothetical protein